MPQPLEAPTPTPAPPASNSGGPLLASPSSPPASWQQVIGHALSTGLGAIAVVKAFAWLPECLSLIRLPSGGVSHDPWSWAPLVLDLAAAVAIAAPVSFRNALEIVKVLPFGRKP